MRTVARLLSRCNKNLRGATELDAARSVPYEAAMDTTTPEALTTTEVADLVRTTIRAKYSRQAVSAAIAAGRLRVLKISSVPLVAADEAARFAAAVKQARDERKRRLQVAKSNARK